MNESKTNIPHTSSILSFVGKESKYVLFDHVGKPQSTKRPQTKSH